MSVSPKSRKAYDRRYYENGGKEVSLAWRKANWERVMERQHSLRKAKGRKHYKLTPGARERTNAKRRADRAVKAISAYRPPPARMVARLATEEEVAEHRRSVKAAWVDRAREVQNQKLRERIAKFPSVRIARNLRSRLSVVIANKTQSLIHQIGCSVAELRAHLESQFTVGMSWDNYGLKGWHIDHKRPCSSFDLTDPDQQRECFHYSNLQPLWALDNLRKGPRYAEATP